MPEWIKIHFNFVDGRRKAVQSFPILRKMYLFPIRVIASFAYKQYLIILKRSNQKYKHQNVVSRIENVCVICLNVWWICSRAFQTNFWCVIIQNVINGRRNSIDKSVFMAWPCALNAFIFEWNLTYSSHETWIYLPSHILIDHINTYVYTYKVYKYFRFGTNARVSPRQRYITRHINLFEFGKCDVDDRPQTNTTLSI